MSDEVEPPEADDLLEVDSPEMAPVDDIFDEEVEDDILGASRITSRLEKPKEKPREEQLDYQNSLPYPVESIEEMDAKLEFIVKRLIACVHAKDYWISLKYPMKRTTRALLANLYFELAVLPGLDTRLVDVAAGMAMGLLESKKRISIVDLQLPWRKIWVLLEKELFPKQRKTGITNVSSTLLSLTEFAQRFFPPHEIPSMLSLFLPRLSSSLNSILATQAFVTHFLPISHPQYYLPAIFKLWEAFNSSIWDEQWLDFMERLSFLHLDPSKSHPELVDELRTMAREKGMDIPEVKVEEWAGMPTPRGEWKGIRKDVGIYTEEQWAFIMTKCLRSMGIPVGGSKTGGEGVAASDFATSDSAATGVALTMKKPAEKLGSFAALIVYSMSEDSLPSGKTPYGSRAPTPPGGVSFGASKEKTYLGGSKALDSLAKFVQATETFYHPSNYGAWAPHLGRFLQNVTWEYYKRQKEEERSDCKTPAEWRLTPNIRRHFVLTMRTVALLSMFSRDPVTIANSQAALKTMAYLEPELIFPAVLERAYPALEGLLETHRTSAIINALSTLSPPLISREIYPAGAKHLIPLLELCLPGLDVNDPMKTMSTAMFVIQAITSVMVDDLTRPELENTGVWEAQESGEDVPMITVEDGDADPDAEPKLSKEEEDRAVRDATSGFPDWVSNFFRQVLAVFDALPEPGKNQRSGGKLEEQMTQTLIAACDFACSQLSPSMFDLALDIVFKQVTSQVRSNSARVVSQLTSCFARADAKKTLAKFLPLCDLNIRAELDSGASSTRSTSTHTPIESDITLHWWTGLLTGAVTNAGASLLPHKDQLKSLLKHMIEHSKSERGYSTTGRILGILLVTLTNVWVKDYRSVNPEEWNSEEWQRGHHLKWGKLYEAKDVKVDWHVPNEEELAFALELLNEIVVPALDTLEQLLRETTGTAPTPAWTNDFCRFTNVVRSALSGIPSLVWLPPPAEPGAVASDAGDEVPEFIDYLPHAQAGIALTDPSDPRHQFVVQIRDRTSQFLHSAVHSLKNNGAEDSIDCVKMIISTMRILTLDYPCDHSHYDAVKKSYDFALQVSRTTKNQKTFPSLRLCSFYRKRSKLDDLLIGDMCELALSTYVQIRRAAQKGLDSMASYFDGTRTLVYPRLFEALMPAPGHDVKKGPTTDYVLSMRAEAALEILHSKLHQNLAILDWRFGPKYLETLLQCAHFERPSVQKSVQRIAHDFVIRLSEPSTLKSSVYSEGLLAAANRLEAATSVPDDPALLAAVEEKAKQRITQKNDAYADLVPKLLAIAEDPTTHWRYALTATRFLRALIRRDQPLRPDVSTYVAKQLVSDLPNMRTHSMLALTKTLHFIKLRTMSAGSAEKLLLQQTSNPLRRKVKLEQPLPADFTEKFIESFSKPMDAETMLMDKQNTGWLVWGDEVEFYAVPPETATAITWDTSSSEAIDDVRALIATPTWWDSFVKHLSQEKTNDYLAADSITVVKSIFQIFGDAPCDHVLPLVEKLIADKADRHKQRAAGELVGGMLRGSKHWPRAQQKRLWDWLTPLFPSIFDGVTPETQVAWEMCAEYILSSRDPRRNQPLVDYLTSLVIDPESSEAFNTAKRQDLVGTAMKSLGWHFAPWAPKYIEMYSKYLDHPFGEVRGAVADNLRHLSELRLHPSYSSVEEFVRESREGAEDSKLSLMRGDAAYQAKIDEFAEKLAGWRAVRQSSAQGTQAYDKASLTLLTWIWTSLSDFRISTAFPFIQKLLREFFAMQEILDNNELKKTATRVTISVACLPFPEELARPLMAQFIDLLKNSQSWRVRLDVLQPLQMFYFHNIFLMDDDLIAELLEQLCELLSDPKIEVREAAAATLSGIVRCSQRSAIVSLSSRFMAIVRSTKIPKRRNAAGEEVAGYQAALVRAHSGVLGIAALVNAFPYEVPPFIPSILIECMSLHATSPVPISGTVTSCLADFKRSHSDSWAEDQKAFTEDQLSSLNDLLMGSSYYA
ncbi:proteasome activator subunit 4 [Pseudohyphozyma bogoriensis]|nr:proteasome activator subunit 4 [Pseudohyphozyma bogoriensis]